MPSNFRVDPAFNPKRTERETRDVFNGLSELSEPLLSSKPGLVRSNTQEALDALGNLTPSYVVEKSEKESKAGVHIKANWEVIHGVDRRTGGKTNQMLNILFGGYLGAAADLRDGKELQWVPKLEKTPDNTSHIGRSDYFMPLIMLSLASIKLSVYLKDQFKQSRADMSFLKGQSEYKELSADTKKAYRVAMAKNIGQTTAWLLFNLIRLPLGVAATLVAPLWNLAVAAVQYVAALVSSPFTNARNKRIEKEAMVTAAPLAEAGSSALTPEPIAILIPNPGN